MSRYDAKQRATVQAAIDSGILNNTNRSHEFVNFVAKLSADKGVTFNFADNAKLRETGFALDGVTVNGFVNDGGVTVNINSAKALNSVVGHEITHVLEGTELYDSLKTAIETYAKGKGDYDQRLEQLTKLYEGKEGYTGEDAAEKIEREVVADLVGDYLFTDEAFVQQLSVKHRNLFQKLYDEIKYLCKIVTAGSKEARQLEKVKKIFEEAYRAEGAKNTVVEDGVRYSLASIEDIIPTEEQKEQNIREVAEMESVYTVDASKLIPGEKSIKEIYHEFFTAWGENIHSDVFGDIAVKNSSIRSEMRHGSTPVKVASIEAIPSVIQNGKIVEWIEKDSGLFRIVVAAPIEIGKSPYYMGVMLQRDAQNQRLYLHDVVIEKEAFELSQEHLDSTGPREENENLYTSSILDKIVEVKRKKKQHQNSLSEQGQTDDIGPLPWTVLGGDVALDDIGPVAETVSATESVEAEEAPVTEVFPDDIASVDGIKTVKERLAAKLTNSQTELANNQKLRDESNRAYNEKIAQLQAEYDAKKNKDTNLNFNLKLQFNLILTSKDAF